MVKENRRIYFTINAHAAPMVRIPPLVDQSKRQALATLEILEIEATVSYKVSLYDGLVLDVIYDGQSVAEGGSLPLGSKVELVVGESNDLPRVLMPNLVGLSFYELDSALQAYSLNLGMIIDCISCETELDSINARVIRTYPQYKEDKRVKMGSVVDIWLSNAPSDTLGDY
jgi:beta-lactam-binding protein with PASTA domain